MKEHKNACEGVVNNPQLFGAIKALVNSTYKKNTELLCASSFDRDDLFQELMLELCEEPVKHADSHYQQLCVHRLYNIMLKLSHAINDRYGLPVTTIPLDEAFAIAMQSPPGAL